MIWGKGVRMNRSLLAFILLIIGVYDIVSAIGSKIPGPQKVLVCLIGLAFLAAALLTVLNEKKRRENQKNEGEKHKS